MAFDPKTWATGELITAEDLNRLEQGLDGKVDGTDSRLTDARTPTEHTHPIGEVSGLQAELDRLARPRVTQILPGVYSVEEQHATSISTGIYQIGA